MSQLDTIMTQTGLPALRRVFGDAAVYTPPYTPPAEPEPVSTWVILRKASDLVGEFGERFESRLTAQLPLTDIPQPMIGSTLTIGATVYRIDQVIEQTAYFSTVALRVAS